MAEQIDPNRDQYDLQAKVLGKTHGTLSMALTVNHQTVFLKYFSKTAVESETAYITERNALKLLGRVGLAPKLTAFSDDDQILIRQYVEGETLRDVVTAETVVCHSRAVGAWLKKCAQRAPSRPGSGNWFEYLTGYPDLRKSSAIGTSQQFLETFEINNFVLSQNTALLRDFVMSAQGPMSVKFARTRMKPAGWDLLLAARALVQLFPEQTDAITKALSDGYSSGTRATSDRYLTLIRLFVLGMVFETGRKVAPPPSHLALEAFNRRRKVKCDAVATSPFLAAKFRPQKKHVIEAFERHVLNLARQVKRSTNPDKLEPKPAPASSSQPPLELGALCRACQGNCCQMGVGKNAFIDRDAVYHVMKANPDKDVLQIAQTYLDFVPKSHVKDSCFFHAKKGCNLPREMRSDTCNRYTCGSAQRLLKTINARPPEGILCIAGTGSNFRKATRTRDGKIQNVPLGRLKIGQAAFRKSSDQTEGDR